MSPANHRQRSPAEQAARDREHEDAREEMRRLEAGDSVPSDPADWPSGKAKFLTFGNESGEPYGDGPTSMLGPAGVELHSDGPSTIRGAADRPETASATRRPTSSGSRIAAARNSRRFSFRRRAR
jgi:hypothetical protein